MGWNQTAPSYWSKSDQNRLIRERACWFATLVWDSRAIWRLWLWLSNKANRQLAHTVLEESDSTYLTPTYWVFGAYAEVWAWQLRPFWDNAGYKQVPDRDSSVLPRSGRFAIVTVQGK
jgi:hypothetical protein